jgi:hypothetical protein
MHVLPPLHTFEQVPQCAPSESRSTHAPSHAVSAPQSSTQCPSTHASVGAQAWLQAPQWSRSSLSETHSVPSAPVHTLPGQAALHVPSTQACPLGHACPQPPQ